MKINLGELSIPEDAFYQPWGILAMTGAGKTNAAAVMAEGLYKARHPFVAIDPVGAWWGLRSSADGKSEGLSVPILGGDHADIPLEDGGGNDVADFVITERASCVVDVSALSENGKHRFLADFADRLLRKNAEPLVVFLEEADDYAPQSVRTKGPAAVTLGRMQALVKRGRFKGITPVMVTQRSAAINKDLLTQIANLVVLRTASPQDRKAIAGWVDTHGASREVLDSLPGLDDGEAWLWSPHALKLMKRFRFRMRETFDSGATPKAGARRAATLADVDLGALEARMKETIERAKEEDPKELRRRIAALERELRTSRSEKSEVQPEVVEKVVEVPRLSNEDIDRIEKIWMGVASVVDEKLEGVHDAVMRLANPLARIVGNEEEIDKAVADAKAKLVPAARSAARPGIPVRESHTESSRPAVAAPERKPDDENGPQIKAGARRMLEVLARHHPMTLTRAQLGTLAKVRSTGGTFKDYFSKLRVSGLIDETDGQVAIAQSGFDVIGYVPTSPLSTEETIEMYRRILKAGARRMLDVLVAAHPDWITRESLAEAAGVTFDGGTFKDYLSKLRTNGLAETSGDSVRAGEALFLGSGR